MHEKDVIHAFQILFTDSNKIQLPKLDFNKKNQRIFYCSQTNVFYRRMDKNNWYDNLLKKVSFV